VARLLDARRGGHRFRQPTRRHAVDASGSADRNRASAPVLVWNQDGQTIVGYNDPKGLAEDYSLTAHATTLDAMSSLLDALASDAAGKK
jgi:hypothetical protein